MKGINKKAVEHNLAHGLKKAFMDKDIVALHRAAQSVVDAGYEFEDIKLLPTMSILIQNVLFETGWVPDFTKIWEAEKRNISLPEEKECGGVMNELEQLPVLVVGDQCEQCGCPRSEAIPCNIDDAGNIIDCHKCTDRMN